MSAITVKQIIVYPIKTLAGVSVDSAEIEPRGLKYDRRWMLVDADGKFISQREFPKLALTSVRFEQDGIVVLAGGQEPLLVPFDLHASETINVRIWADETVAFPVDPVAAEWFSTYIGSPATLVVMPQNTVRPITPTFFPTDTVSFADEFPIMLLGENSLNDLNTRLDKPLPMNRFRPNIVTTGHDAFSEDTWADIKIGSEHIHGVYGCARCSMTTIDQETAERGIEPLKTLATFRKFGQKIIFGRDLIPETTGWIHVGDPVEVLSYSDPLAGE
jgi:uncharacterized protein YcbX